MPWLLPFPPARRGRGELIQANVGTNPLVKAGPDPIICSAKEHVPRHTKPSRKTRTEHLSSLTKTPGSALPAPGSTDSGHHTLAEQAERAGRRNLPRVSSLLGAGEEAAGTFDPQAEGSSEPCPTTVPGTTRARTRPRLYPEVGEKLLRVGARFIWEEEPETGRPTTQSRGEGRHRATLKWSSWAMGTGG